MESFEKLMMQVLKPSGSSPIYNCMVSILDEKKGLHFSKSVGHIGENGELITNDHAFKVGSITKLFTATVIFQLIEEGSIRSENKFFDLIESKSRKVLSGLHRLGDRDHSHAITVRHLLQHSSGLRDYFSDDSRFLGDVMLHPAKSWDWKKVMEKYFEFGLHCNPLFEPGSGFHYADTNYLLLGILIEERTGKRLSQVFKERIAAPLTLQDTWLEFYECPINPRPLAYPYYGSHSLENVNTSFDWGGGGLVSTMRDLELFIRALLKGRLFKKKETLVQALKVMQQREFTDYSFFGHNSAYGSMLFYEAEKDISIVISLNQAGALLKAEWLMKKMVSLL